MTQKPAGRFPAKCIIKDVIAPFDKPYLFERPDRVDPAIDFVGFG
jgi:hypothetical protein